GASARSRSSTLLVAPEGDADVASSVPEPVGTVENVIVASIAVVRWQIYPFEHRSHFRRRRSAEPELKPLSLGLGGRRLPRAAPPPAPGLKSGRRPRPGRFAAREPFGLVRPPDDRVAPPPGTRGTAPSAREGHRRRRP